MGKKFTLPSIYEMSPKELTDRLALPHEVDEFTMENFFKRSNYEVGTLDGVRISVDELKVVKYSEGELHLKLHSEVDFYLSTFFETHIFVPEDLSWPNGTPISKEKRESIIKNLIQGLYLLGSYAVIHPDGNHGLLDAVLTERDDLAPNENFRDLIDTLGNRKTQSKFFPVLEEDTSVYASGINLQAYPEPGDPRALLKAGLMPYECTTRYEAIKAQLDNHPEFTYYQRSMIYVDDMHSIYCGARGDLKFFPGSMGLGDYKLLWMLPAFLINSQHKKIKSINGIPISSHLELLQRLSSDQELLSVEDLNLFTQAFYGGSNAEACHV